MIKIAICDDEKFYTDSISKLLSKKSSSFDIDVFHSGNAFLQSKKIYDIIFMDIELPDVNGINLLRKNHYNSIIIILTSHNEEILNGYYVNAFRFLIKPIDHYLFYEALSGAINELRKNICLECIDDNNIINKISIHDIVYAEASGKKSGIRTLKNFYYTNIQIGNLYKLLDDDFYFVHRSYIINMNYVSKIDVKKRNIQMQENSIIPVSRLKWKFFRESFYLFLKKQMNGASL